MALTDSGDDSDDDARRRLGTQVLWYQRDRLACRLKLLGGAQLVASCWYAVGPRVVPSGRFGALCGCGALLGLSAAHTVNRSLLYAHALLSGVVGSCAALLLQALALALPTDVARQSASHSLLLGFGGLTVAVLLLQLLAVRLCVGLLCLPASWRATSEGDTLLSMAEELDDLDLAEAPELPVVSAPDVFPTVRCDPHGGHGKRDH